MELQSSILEIAEQVKKRVVSPVELTRDCLQRIERLNSTLNAFITITAGIGEEPGASGGAGHPTWALARAVARHSSGAEGHP